MGGYGHVRVGNFRESVTKTKLQRLFALEIVRLRSLVESVDSLKSVSSFSCIVSNEY